MENKDGVFNFKLSDEDKRQLIVIAHNHQRSKGDTIRLLIHRAYDALMRRTKQTEPEPDHGTRNE